MFLYVYTIFVQFRQSERHKKKRIVTKKGLKVKKESQNVSFM